MKNFIEELYYGNIDPQNSGFEDDESVQSELRTISESPNGFSGTARWNHVMACTIPPGAETAAPQFPQPRRLPAGQDACPQTANAPRQRAPRTRC